MFYLSYSNNQILGFLPTFIMSRTLLIKILKQSKFFGQFYVVISRYKQSISCVYSEWIFLFHAFYKMKSVKDTISNFNIVYISVYF